MLHHIHAEKWWMEIAEEDGGERALNMLDEIGPDAVEKRKYTDWNIIESEN